jgi:hypothetical protein
MVLVGASALLISSPGCRRAGSGSARSFTPAVDEPFLVLSRTLTGAASLSPTTANRMAAFLKVAPVKRAALGRLEDLTKHADQDPSRLLEFASQAGVRDAADEIVRGWYTGTLGAGTGAKTFAYSEALMYRAVADVLAPPTYAFGGPGWWAADPTGDAPASTLNQSPA